MYNNAYNNFTNQYDVIANILVALNFLLLKADLEIYVITITTCILYVYRSFAPTTIM